MKREDGGPAFPVADYDHMIFQPKTVAETKRDLYGMSLRDYFAAKAMQAGLCTLQSPGAVDSVVKRANQLGIEVEVMFARDSYAMADAMLAARSA